MISRASFCSPYIVYASLVCCMQCCCLNGKYCIYITPLSKVLYKLPLINPFTHTLTLIWPLGAIWALVASPRALWHVDRRGAEDWTTPVISRELALPPEPRTPPANKHHTCMLTKINSNNCLSSPSKTNYTVSTYVLLIDCLMCRAVTSKTALMTTKKNNLYECFLI